MISAHTGHQLQAIAASRRIAQADVIEIRCSCGAFTFDVAAAFGMGFGHLSDCYLDRNIQFRTATTPIGKAPKPPKPSQPIHQSYRYRLPNTKE